jgi:hypothetical protein
MNTKKHSETLSLLSELRYNYPTLRWVNVYRRYDPIGAQIGLPPEIDRATPQRMCGIAAHANYWSDPFVLRQIRLGLSKASSHVPVPPYKTHVGGTQPQTRQLWMSDVTGIVVATSVAFLFLLFSTVLSVRASILPPIVETINMKRLRSEPSKVVPGKLYKYREVSGGSFVSFAMPYQVVKAEFKMADVMKWKEVRGSAVALPRLIEQSVWSQGALPKSGLRAETTAVQVRYLSAEPDVFTVVGFEQDRILWKNIVLGIISFFPWFAVLTALAYFAWRSVGVHVAEIFAGIRELPDWLSLHDQEFLAILCLCLGGAFLALVSFVTWK